MSVLIAKHWWSVLIRGLVGVGVGISLLVWTVPTVKVLFWLIAIFAAIDGLVLLIAALVAKDASGTSRALLVLGGLVSIGIGVALVTWPKISVGAVILLIGAWWLVTGVFQLIDGLMDRQAGSRGWTLFSGALSVVAGLILLFNPEIGAEALVFVVAIFAIIIGLLNVILSFALRGTDLTLTVTADGSVIPPQPTHEK
ncbi:MAG: HdeD family acid-resistance protein [Acidimicrobiia bacterium]